MDAWRLRSPDTYSGTEGRQRYYTNPLETSALERNGSQHPRRGDFTAIQTPYPFYYRMGEFQSCCGQALKNFSSIGIRHPNYPAHSDSLFRSPVYGV
jgi:hypothetical protein